MVEFVVVALKEDDTFCDLLIQLGHVCNHQLVPCGLDPISRG